MVFFMAACTQVPDVVKANVALQQASWQNAHADMRTVVLAYDKQLRKAYDKQLAKYFKSRMAETQPTTKLADDTFDRVMAKRKELWGKLDAKRDEFLADENIARGAKSAEMTADYLRSLEDGFGAIEGLANLVPVARKAVDDLLGGDDDP